MEGRKEGREGGEEDGNKDKGVWKGGRPKLRQTQLVSSDKDSVRGLPCVLPQPGEHLGDLLHPVGSDLIPGAPSGSTETLTKPTIILLPRSKLSDVDRDETKHHVTLLCLLIG